MTASKLPLSEKTKEGMSLTVDDQKWIKLLFDRQDEINVNNSIKIIETFKDLLVQHKKEIFSALDRINLRLDSIEASLDNKESRLMIIERHISPSGTFLRVGLGVVIGVMISILTFIIIHPYLKDGLI